MSNLIYNNIISLTTEGRLVGIETADLASGVTAGIEQAISNKLKTLRVGDSDVFLTAEPWNYQTAASEGGIEAFTKYTPFAFVRNGQIQFLSDCTHKMAGQTVDLPDFKGRRI